jgi:hypothetical protein
VKYEKNERTSKRVIFEYDESKEFSICLCGMEKKTHIWKILGIGCGERLRLHVKTEGIYVMILDYIKI